LPKVLLYLEVSILRSGNGVQRKFVAVASDEPTVEFGSEVAPVM
jgi:hypothetical protein